MSSPSSAFSHNPHVLTEGSHSSCTSPGSVDPGPACEIPQGAGNEPGRGQTDRDDRLELALRALHEIDLHARFNRDAYRAGAIARRALRELGEVVA